MNALGRPQSRRLESLSKAIAPGSKSSTTVEPPNWKNALFLAALARPWRVRLDDAGDVDSTDLNVGNLAEGRGGR